MEARVRELLQRKADEFDLAPSVPPAMLTRVRRRRTFTVVVTAATAAAVVVGAITGLAAIRHRAAPLPFESGVRPVFDRSISVGDSAEDVAYGFGSAWVQMSGRSIPVGVKRIDPRSGAILATFGQLLPPAHPGEAPRSDSRFGRLSGLAVGEGAVWSAASTMVTSSKSVSKFSITASPVGGPQPSATFGGVATIVATGGALPHPTQVPSMPKPDSKWQLFKIDPGTNRGAFGPEITGWDPRSIAVGAGSIWVAGGWVDQGIVYRLDPRTMRVAGEVPVRGYPARVVADGGAVWVAVGGRGADSLKLLRIDPATNAVTARISLPGEGPVGLAAGEGAVWTTVQTGSPPRPQDLFRIDPRTNRIVASIRLDEPITDITVGAGFVWGSPSESVLVWVDSSTNRVAGRLRTKGGSNGGIALGDGKLWIAGIPYGGDVSQFDLRPR
jgi:hypothetical protein